MTTADSNSLHGIQLVAVWLWEIGSFVTNLWLEFCIAALVWLLFVLNGMPAAPAASTDLHTAVFDVPAAKTDWNRDQLKPPSQVIVIPIRENKSGETQPISETTRYNGTLIKVLDAAGMSLQPPYTAAATLRLSVLRGEDDENAIKFASAITSTTRILLLPAQ